MKGTVLFAAASLLAWGGGCEPRPSSAPTASAAMGCPPFDKVDRAKLSTRWEDWDGQDVAVFWAGWRDELETPDPSSVVRLQISVTPYPDAKGHEQFDVRGHRVENRWKMERRQFASQTEDPRNATLTPWEEFALPEADGRALDVMLAGECLWASPRFLPAQVPLKDGRTQFYIHAPLTLFDIHHGDREWGGAHAVMAGDPGRITSLLVGAAFYPGRPQWLSVRDFETDFGVSRPADPAAPAPPRP